VGYQLKCDYLAVVVICKFDFATVVFRIILSKDAFNNTRVTRFVLLTSAYGNNTEIRHFATK